MQRLRSLAAVGLLGLATVASAASGFDFGKLRDHELRAFSRKLFGIVSPIKESSTTSIAKAAAEADPTLLATFARGLRVQVVTSAANAGPNLDMMVLWPDDEHATHLIACNEQGATAPGVQRIHLTDGAVETILTGTISCDPVRRTPWGTVIVGEEAGNSGWLLEIINPLATTNVLFDRGAGTTTDGPGGSGADNVVTRPAVGRLSWEGIALYPNGVMYYGDENRPSQGTPGGAYFKFVPAVPWIGGAPISDLSESPLVSGTVYGLRLGKRNGNTDYGQGSNTGLGTWVLIPDPSDLRTSAGQEKLAGYYRPEDIDIDGKGLARGDVRFCGNNTGNEGTDRNWGETICITDGSLEDAIANLAVPEAQLFVVGTPELAMMDNIAYQPGRGNWILHEDGDGPDIGRNNDLWSCLKDGKDDDRLSDGCVRIATLNDLNAEWTGGFFDTVGDKFYVSVQHNVTGHGVVLRVTGWR